ncbi:hypothetical protein MIR68_000449 [Amoeboaphelidium protococcarum]|nr:hypothetical protein MIR68_000449 [Amoeboaphelidium protococcarum]
MQRAGHPLEQMGGWIHAGISGSNFVLDTRSPARNQQLINDFCSKRSQFIANHQGKSPATSTTNQVQTSTSTPIQVQQAISTPTQVGSIHESASPVIMTPSTTKRTLVDAFSQSAQPPSARVHRNGPPVKKVKLEVEVERLQQLVKIQEDYIESLERELKKMRVMYSKA